MDSHNSRHCNRIDKLFSSQVQVIFCKTQLTIMDTPSVDYGKSFCMIGFAHVQPSASTVELPR